MKSHFRTLTFDVRSADTAQRTVPVTISSEYPVNRGGYAEVLLHGPENVDQSRFPLPLIEAHDSSRINIGVVENIRPVDRKLRGTVRFGSSARAQEVWEDVVDGIVRNVSVGYVIDDYEIDGDTLRATRWTPYEVSLVAAPADPSAGLNRGHSTPSESTESMTENTEGLPAADAGERLTRSQRRALNAPSEADHARDAERKRVSKILAIGEIYKNRAGVLELARAAAADGRSVEDFRAEVDKRIANTPVSTAELCSRGYGAQREYSIVRALRSMIDPRAVDAGYEREVSQEIATRVGRKPRGMYFPMGEMSTRAVTAAGAPALIGTEHLSSGFIDALRARSVVMNLGPTMLTGLTGDVSVPRLSASATAYWIAGDGSDSLTESTPTFDALSLSPKFVGGLVKLSRKSVLQSDPAADLLVRDDLAQVIAGAIDKAAIQGTGTSNQPVGVVNTTGITSDTFAGTTPTFAEIVAMESALLGSNVDGALSYLTTPALSGTLKTTTIASGSDQMIWQNSSVPGVGVMNGLPARSTNNAPAKKIILGNWQDFVIGLWGAVDIDVNPFDDFGKGVISVRCFASVDFGVRHAPSFAVYSLSD